MCEVKVREEIKLILALTYVSSMLSSVEGWR